MGRAVSQTDVLQAQEQTVNGQKTAPSFHCIGFMQSKTPLIKWKLIDKTVDQLFC
jgi:hypothetical protein